MVEMVASPQTEDGFTMIANELFEALLGYELFTGRQFKVAMAIVRKTYGYGKKEDDMSASQIGELCDMSRNHVTETIRQLVEMNVVTRKEGKYGLILGINKHYQSWKQPEADSPKIGLVPNTDSPKTGLAEVVPIRDVTSPKTGQVDSPKTGHTKENLSKENQQKKTRGPRAKKETTFSEWIEQTRQTGEDPIPEDHAVFSYAREIGLPIHYLRLCWLEFKDDHTSEAREGKKQKSWPSTFLNYVKNNYYKLWFVDNQTGEFVLTTRGKQLEKAKRNA